MGKKYVVISVVNVDIFQMEFIELCTWQKCIALIETAFGTNQTLMKRSRFHDTLRKTKHKSIKCASMIFWYSSHRRAACAQTSLLFRAVSTVPSLLAYTKLGCRFRPKLHPYSRLNTRHGCFKMFFFCSFAIIAKVSCNGLNIIEKHIRRVGVGWSFFLH